MLYASAIRNAINVLRNCARAKGSRLGLFFVPNDDHKPYRFFVSPLPGDLVADSSSFR